MSGPPSMVLALHTGSSSLKFALFEMGAGVERRLADGAVLHIGDAEGPAWLRHGDMRIERRSSCNDYEAALDYAFNLLAQRRLDAVDLVGHRVVHGGPDHVRPERVDAALLKSLHDLVPLAPVHLPACLSAMSAVEKRMPTTPQVACFDTAFHATLPELARRLPLPGRFHEARRYGFHGLSYEYVMSTLGPDRPSRIVIAHLGNGSSIVAVKDGRAVDTTMGLTPTGGILMGTRTGDLDPGVLFYLARQYSLDITTLERVVNQESGLNGIAGTADMQALLKRVSTDAAAALAVEMYAYGIKKAIGAFIAALGGIDLLVFTGGIGEHAARIRTDACRGLEAFGLVLDAELNPRGAGVVSLRSSPAMIKVVHTDEDLVIARHAYRLMS